MTDITHSAISLTKEQWTSIVWHAISEKNSDMTAEESVTHFSNVIQKYNSALGVIGDEMSLMQYYQSGAMDFMNETRAYIMERLEAASRLSLPSGMIINNE